MIKDCDIKILTELRKNSRQPLTNISKNTDIPVSTVYDRIRASEKYVIKKHTSILDFPKIGYSIRAGVLANFDDQAGFIEFSKNNYNINSVFKMEGDYQFMIDCIFSRMLDFQLLMKEFEKYGIKEKLAHFITEEIVRENFVGYDKNGLDES
ncbi:MAG: winged helix-turn-helix transcriptional regulator [Candidatus Woesearchaeota archaeon]